MAPESGFKACSQYSDFNLSDSPKKKKPCEICGSFANELLIMSCFNCRERREHIYCAKVMLRRVPSMWLCEECRKSSSLVEIADKTANSQVEKAADSIHHTAPSSRAYQVFHNRDFIHQTDPLRTDQVMDTEAAPSSNSNQVVINKDLTLPDPLSRTKRVEHLVVLDVVPHIHQYSTSEESSVEPSYAASPCSSLVFKPIWEKFPLKRPTRHIDDLSSNSECEE